MAGSAADLLGIVGRLHEGVAGDEFWQDAIGSVCESLKVPVMLAGAIARGGTSVELEFGFRAAPAAITALEGPLASP